MPNWQAISNEPDKTCLFCEHYYISVGSPGYSEYTPGSDFSMDCNKGHWDFKQYDTEAHYRGCLVTAQSCPDYNFNPLILVQIENK